MIRFDHVVKKYRDTPKPALDDINFEVDRGEFVFLVGASGSGKSSCLRLILKEDKPSKGSLHVLGQDVSAISNRKVPYFRRNIGVVFQDFRLLPNKTVFQNVAFTLQVLGKSRGFIHEAVPDVLKMVGLDGKANRMPHELSGGEQQRVAIARAVANKPQILLADEPTGNLDPTTSAGIMQVMERISVSGTTILMATHEAGIVDQMKKRVIELDAGRIVRDEKRGGYGETASIPIIKQQPAPAPTGPAAVQLPTGVIAAVSAPVGVDTSTIPAPEVTQVSATSLATAASPRESTEQSAAETPPATAAPSAVSPATTAPTPSASQPPEPRTRRSARAAARNSPRQSTAPARSSAQNEQAHRSERLSQLPEPLAGQSEPPARTGQLPVQPTSAPYGQVTGQVSLSGGTQQTSHAGHLPGSLQPEQLLEQTGHVPQQLSAQAAQLPASTGQVPVQYPVSPQVERQAPQHPQAASPVHSATNPVMVPGQLAQPAPAPTNPELAALTGDLTLAARLGLRKADETDVNDEQDVGPVR